MTSVSKCSLAAIIVGIGCSSCVEQSDVLTDDQIVDGWLEAVSSRAPIEVRLVEGEGSGACEVPEYPDETHTWADGLVRLEVGDVASIHETLGAAPVWAFGPSQKLSESDEPALYAAAPWAGSADITCGGESVSGSLVLLEAADPMERLQVFTREELRDQMSANVEADGLAPVVDADLSKPICPDTSEGCDEG